MSVSSRRHIPYLPFHKTIIREICTPQKDDLLILAKGLGLRRVICALLKTYDRKEDLVLVVNATPADEAGVGDELGIMGVRDPGFRILTYEMSVQQREEMYRLGGLFSVTSKILVNDLLKGTVPAKLITGLVILHAEKVSHGSQEEFAVRLYRRENQSGFCKAFSDEPEQFAHGLSPLKDMLVNLNMTNVMIWPRFNEAVKVSLATRKAEVVELYQPMTDLMRQCQDSITECMEAMLVELKRDHSLNLDLEDINVRNAQFKNFDTIVRMRLKPVWHKVGAKTRIHVASLTELRNLHTWLLEYDSATFASYINGLHRDFFQSQKLPPGYAGRHQHDWFNARAAGTLVSASQGRVSQKKAVMDNESENPADPNDGWDSAGRRAREEAERRSQTREFEDDEDALRSMQPTDATPEDSVRTNEEGEDEEDDEVMDVIATQSRPKPGPEVAEAAQAEVEDDELREIEEGEDTVEPVPRAAPPPTFRPVHFGVQEDVGKSVQKRLRKGHEAVLEELPKWSLLAKVLKEIEDTMARIQTSHADEPGTNIVLVMVSSDRSALQLRQYLTTMAATEPPFGPQAGRRMMQTLFLSNWQHEKSGAKFGVFDPARQRRGLVNEDEVYNKGELEKKRTEDRRAKSGQPYYKRRRIRGGMTAPGSGRQSAKEMDMEQREAMMKAQSAFAGGDGGSETPFHLSAAFQETRRRGMAAAMASHSSSTTDVSSFEDATMSGNDSRTVPAANASESLVSNPEVDAEHALLLEAEIVDEEDLVELASLSQSRITAEKGVASGTAAAAAADGIDASPEERARTESSAAYLAWLEQRGLAPEDYETEYGLLDPGDTVIIRPYGGEDDDIMLNELRPRFVVCYEPNLAFIRRLEVYKNCNPGLALRVYQMVYSNSFEEDRFLSTMTREDEAFKKLIDDRTSMVIPIYNNNPRAPMRDTVSRSKTTYSSRNAGGGEQAEEARIIVDIREMGALLPSLLDAAGIKVVPNTLTIGDYVLSPKMCVERKALPDLEASFGNGRLHTQCEAMTSHYEICILLIEFEEDRFGLRTKDDTRRDQAGRGKPAENNFDDYYLQSKLVLLALHFPRLRIIWSSSPHESVRILSDLKLNHDEPDELSAVMKGSTTGDVSSSSGSIRPEIENAAAVEMLRAIPGVSGHNLKHIMTKVESMSELVSMEKRELVSILGESQGRKAHKYLHFDGRFGEAGYAEPPPTPTAVQ